VLDFISGDGALSYAPEQTLEAYFNLEVRQGRLPNHGFSESV
jgi:hypothetical protein